MNLMRGIDLAKIAEKLPGASGAEIKAVCTEAGMYALRERRVHVTQEDFEMAVAKVWTFCIVYFMLKPEYLCAIAQVMAKDNEKNMSLKKLFK
jgi:26S proteasome regulatory subunit T6